MCLSPVCSQAPFPSMARLACPAQQPPDSSLELGKLFHSLTSFSSWEPWASLGDNTTGCGLGSCLTVSYIGSQGGKEYLMRAHFGLPSVEAEDKEGKPPISVKFEIPYFTTSGIQV